MRSSRQGIFLPLLHRIDHSQYLVEAHHLAGLRHAAQHLRQIQQPTLFLMIF